MEAVASPLPWIPEDDLRLKDAMETGASLEALARGAVRFSRKFTIGELRDRWYSLLYDADVSAEASARLVELEGCNSNSASKAGRFTLSRGLNRKSNSIRKHYYAMRKIERKHCAVNSVDHDSYQKEFFDRNFLFGPDVDDGKALEENFGVGDHNQPVFLDCDVDNGNATHAFRGGECVSIGNHGVEGGGECVSIGNHGMEGGGECVSIGNLGVEGVVGEGCSNGFVEQVSLLPGSGLGENDFCHDNACHDLPTHRDDGIDFGNASDAEDIGPSHASIDEPLWKTIEDVPAPEMPMDVSMGVNGEGARKTLAVTDDMDVDNIGSSQYEVDHSEELLNDELIRSVTISGGDYADIYLANDELTFMDVNGKESIDKFSSENLNPILLSETKDVHENDAPNFCQPPKLVSDSCQAVTDNVRAAEMDVASEPSHSDPDDQHVISCSEANMTASTSVPHPLTPEHNHEEMICTLNTEDPEIPCNDDIFPSAATVHAVVQPTLKGAHELASSTGKRNCDQQRKEEDPTRPFKVPRMVGYDTSRENSPNHALGSFGVKAPFGDSNCVASISKHDKTVIADQSQSRSAHAPGLEAPFTIAELAPLFTEPGSTTLPEPEANPAALDHEESEEESDDDVDDDDADIPCFSDIEAMILEMDLCPLDQDSYISSEVLGYQNEDSKRNIIRFEQCARSSMQRTLASKGALAVLYGNHIKKYIKKTEVIIGRSTEDNEVDIDLGKEGLHNKISRRQALIKMEGDGSFSLKNLGKSSIYLNGEEVATGQLVSLGSSNLIEIREMYFNFETNHKSVRQYMGRIGQKSEDKYTKLERSPEGGP
ncbi:uncharacterized protein [Pyrus communis]|uniref:uncharacterized protein isoform X2 n=1 Tax=Pyrus communis TaxID=23211 RepID=UPI0035BED37D